MRVNRLLSFIFIATVSLAGCAVPTLAPTATLVPTPAPTATTAATATAAPATPAASPTLVGVASAADVNDATHARLRASNCIFGGPSVDVLVNGAVAMNGGLPIANLGALDASGYLYLTPATYQVAIVPTGKSVAEALVGPVVVPVVAGHRYTLAMLGQVGEARLTPLVVDETAAYQALGLSPTGDAHITINNIKGVAGIDFSLGGIVRDQNAPYGGFKAALWPVGNFQGLAVTVSGAPDQFIDSGPGGFNTPGTDSLDCFAGAYPGTMGQNFDTHTSQSVSSLNASEFLQGFSGKNLTHNGEMWSFDTLLAAIKTAGLTDLYTTGGPLLFFAPSDAAFAALPRAQRDALLADPQSLAKLLRAHTVAGYVPLEALTTAITADHPYLTLNTLTGRKITLGNHININGNGQLGDFGSNLLANGTVVIPIDQVLPAGP